LGVVFNWKDKARGRRVLVKEGLRDLSPGVADSVLSLLESWKGSESEEKLISLVGKEKAKPILKTLRESSSEG
jgi:hypothetical protein